MAEIVKYLWDFGDGETSTEKNPQHDYMEGVWTVSLTYWDSNGNEFYDAEYDYVIVTPLDWTKEYNPSLPDTCYWSPVKGGQGFGVSEFNGDDWIWPACFNSMCYAYDDERNRLLLVVDERTQSVHQINNTEIWKDKEEYDVESEIHVPSNISHKGPWTHIKHEETRINLAPYYKEIRDESNGQVFDEDGFPEDIETTIKAYSDRIHSPATAKATNIPKDGDIVFHQALEGREIRRHIVLSKAPWYFTGINGVFSFEDKNSPDGEGVLSELSMQENILSSPFFWFSRTYTPMENLAKKQVASGDVGVSNLSEGFDSRPDSAILMPTNSGITDSFNSGVGDVFTLISWIDGFPDPGDEGYLFQSGSVAITVELSADQIILRMYGLTVFDIYTQTFDLQDKEWHNFIVCADSNDDTLQVYYNGEAVKDTAIAISSNLFVSGDEFTVYWGFSGISVAETKMIPILLSAEEALYYYQDCVYRCGDGVQVF